VFYTVYERSERFPGYWNPIEDVLTQTEAEAMVVQHLEIRRWREQKGQLVWIDGDPEIIDDKT
jgi:hypothetical protein